MIFLLYLSIPIGIDPVETNEALSGLLSQHCTFGFVIVFWTAKWQCI
jgi:hypothetical protein